MSDMDFGELFALLVETYPAHSVGSKTVRVYELLLSDLDASSIRAAAVEHCLTSKYFPSVADLRSLACRKQLGAPSSAEAMEMLTSGDAFKRDAHPLILRAVKAAIGTKFDWDRSDRPGILRMEFKKAYEGLLAAEMRKAIVNHALGESAIKQISAGD